ncbi:MAG TPA: hypothetical protein VKA44_02800, partial [Gemmatimonadota bacterium]|nr:hypothetical protein [Gemmatimonadota bacterium]
MSTTALALAVRTLLALAAPPLAPAAGPSAADAVRRGGDPALSPPDTSAPAVLVLGSDHLSKRERRVPEDRIRPVVEGLERFHPDMVVVEYLPADWPAGEGRDYRKDFDLDARARRWDIPRRRAGALLDSLEDAGRPPRSEPCRAARLQFLRRDLADAAYLWLGADCPAEADTAIASWLDRISEHELARVAFPVARASGLEHVVSFDYQGSDASWFIEDAMRRARRQGPPRARRQ